jgi:hypothetical protein
VSPSGCMKGTYSRLQCPARGTQSNVARRIRNALGNPTCVIAIGMPFNAEIALRQLPALAVLMMHRARLPVVLPLIVACRFLLAYIPWSASRGRFHIPGFGGVAILGFGCGLLLGHLSGARGVTGTVVGISLATVFFLLMAVAGGCLLALFFYRPPAEE